MLRLYGREEVLQRCTRGTPGVVAGEGAHSGHEKGWRMKPLADSTAGSRTGRYDQATGAFVWRVSRGSVAAGSLAGTVRGKGYRASSWIDKPPVRGEGRSLGRMSPGSGQTVTVDHRDTDPSNYR